MHGPNATLSSLSRSERGALLAVLTGATAAAGRSAPAVDLETFVAQAPMAALPAAASLHRVGGSVLRGLDAVAGVPDEVRTALVALRQRSAMRHLLLASPMSLIKAEFMAANISWVVMKGPVVATLLYPEVGDRSYGDLDLLVARRDFPRATRLLEGLGYRHHIRNWALAEQQLAGQISMSDDLVSIDLHWHLHYTADDRRAFRIEPEAMIERHRHVDVSGVPIPTFDPVDTLLTLAFHAARSDGHRLLWLKDLERSVSVEHPDLDELVARARVAGCAPAIGVMLDRARRILGADVSREAVNALTPPTLRALDRATSGVVSPVQLHDRPTVTRVATRSLRASAWATIAAVPGRAARSARRRLCPPLANETDRPDEQQRYFEAVVRSCAT
jgi:hypothetical protein